MAIRVYTKEYFSVKRHVAHLFSYVSLTLGALLLFWSVYPFVSFQIYAKLFIQQDMASPVPLSQILAASGSDNKAVLGSYNVYSSNLRDFVNADLWFPSAVKNVQEEKIEVKEYTISIPKLNIVNAKVSVGGDDLSNSLVHYLPESLPGENGNVSIFGHSSLPYNYDPKNYKTIFTYLPSIEKNDRVFTKVGKKTFEYEVYDIFIVKPDQVSILEQRYDAPYLTLVTCVPPGDTAYRLVVRAKLVNSL